MTLTAAERMSFLFTCPRCSKANEKSVAWLTTYEVLPCATSGCGNMINLKTPKNSAIIEALSEQCDDVDALLEMRD